MRVARRHADLAERRSPDSPSPKRSSTRDRAEVEGARQGAIGGQHWKPSASCRADLRVAARARDLWACNEAGDDCLRDYAVGDAGTHVGGLYQPWLI